MRVSKTSCRVVSHGLFAFLAGILLIGLTACTCIRPQELPVTPATTSITHRGVIINAATLPNDNPATIGVDDRYPGGAVDGKNEIWIGWSQTTTRPATINFPETTFGDGPGVVWVHCTHYNACRLEAYDKNNNLLSSAVHTSNQGVVQVLKLSGGAISRIDVIGAEILILDICYKRAARECPKYSVSVHTGLAIPTGIFGRVYDPGLNLIFDVDYHFTPQLSIMGIFGYNRFHSNVALLGDTYWLNFSANVKYRIIPGNFTPYVALGPGLYVPENGSNRLGLNLGFGLDYDLDSTLTLEVGADYHKLFDVDVKFWHVHAGVIFRF